FGVHTHLQCRTIEWMFFAEELAKLANLGILDHDGSLLGRRGNHIVNRQARGGGNSNCRWAGILIGRSGFAAGWGERAGWVVRTGRGLGAERVWCDTLGFPAVVAGVLWPPHTKGYHDVRTQKPYDPGHAARRAGRRDPTRVSAGCPPTGRLLHGFARSPQRAERRGLPPLRPR